jgi:hypothetical protein
MMIDGGNDAATALAEAPDRNFVDVRKSDANQHRWFLGDDLSGIPVSGLTGGLGGGQVRVIDRAWSPDQKEKLQKILSDKAYLEEERAFWLQQLPQQPTHRAVLWNLHLLESALGNKTQASVYEKQARQVDPNFVFPAK